MTWEQGTEGGTLTSFFGGFFYFDKMRVFLWFLDFLLEKILTIKFLFLAPFSQTKIFVIFFFISAKFFCSTKYLFLCKVNFFRLCQIIFPGAENFQSLLQQKVHVSGERLKGFLCSLCFLFAFFCGFFCRVFEGPPPTCRACFKKIWMGGVKPACSLFPPSDPPSTSFF